MLTTHQGNIKYHRGFPLTLFTYVIPDTHKKFQPNIITIEICIVPHQTAAQKRYLLDIIASGSLDTSNVIAKSTVTNQSGKWDRWCTFLKHSGIADKFLGGIPRAENNTCAIICRFSAKKLFRHNQETNTPPRNCQVRHIGCICFLPDAPSERPDPRVLRPNILTLTETTTGIQNSGNIKKTSKNYTRKSSLSHLQADKHTSEHSHRPTYCRHIFF